MFAQRNMYNDGGMGMNGVRFVLLQFVFEDIFLGSTSYLICILVAFLFP